MLTYPWIADGIVKWEAIAIEHLAGISKFDERVAASILAFPWFVDGVSAGESSAVSTLYGLTEQDRAFANEVIELWWVPPDMPQLRQHALGDIRELALQDLALARHAIAEPFMGPPLRQRDEYALLALVSFASESNSESELLAQLKSEPWFSDGIDDLEAALLYAIANSSEDFRQALIDTHYVASVPVSLPLSGEIELVVVRYTPFPSDDHTFATLEGGVRAMERFIGAPLPVSDVVLLLLEPEIWDVGTEKFIGTLLGGGNEPGYWRALILASDHGAGPSEGALYHEVAHHYGLEGRPWLSEGVAQFFEAYMLARTGGQSLEERLASIDTYDRCERENIQQHIDDYGGRLCNYDLGEKFMLAMYAALGQEPMSAALRELYTKSLLSVYLDEDTIYHAFRSNVPPDKEEAFKGVYRQYHGGPLVDSDPEANPDRPGLIALYDSTGGANWDIAESWGSSAPLGTWYGVATEVRGRVRIIELEENGLVGKIPPELGSLSDLRNLSLSVNSLVGEIPPELGNLSNLVSLGLGGNKLTGGIPPELGNLSNLQYLGLWENQMTGAIPPELAGMTSMSILDVQSNQLTGHVPPELAGLANLTWLTLDLNRLSGPIPLELAGLSNLISLRLEYNRLSGPIPTELAGLSNLEHLRLKSNLLNGEVPPELGNLENLESLRLGNNQLTGRIPAELGNLTKLWSLELGGNELSGEIPPQLGNLVGLLSLDLSLNQLSGQIPAELGNLTELKWLFLGGNNFIGCIPKGLRDVQVNDLAELELPDCGDSEE